MVLMMNIRYCTKTGRKTLSEVNKVKLKAKASARSPRAFPGNRFSSNFSFFSTIIILQNTTCYVEYSCNLGFWGGFLFVFFNLRLEVVGSQCIVSELYLRCTYALLCFLPFSFFTVIVVLISVCHLSLR